MWVNTRQCFTLFQAKQTMTTTGEQRTPTSRKGAGRMPALPLKGWVFQKRPGDDEKDQRQHFLMSAVGALEKAHRPANDECDTFGILITQTLRQIPAGPLRQTGILRVYQAMVNYLASIQTATQGVEIVERVDVDSTLVSILMAVQGVEIVECVDVDST